MKTRILKNPSREGIVCRATSQDREEILFLWNEYILRHRFGKEWESVEYHVFGERDFNVYENCLLIKDNKSILAAAAVIPMFLSISGVKLSVGVITGVVTRPEYRRKGFMVRLMNAIIAEMDSKGLLLGILWGYRDRYQRFGFEICGRKKKYFIPRRKFREVSKKDLKKIRELNLAKDETFIRRLSGVHCLDLENSRDQVLRKFQRGLTRSYIFDDRRKKAIVVINDSPISSPKILEVFYTAGDFQGVLMILNHLMTSREHNECMIIADPVLKEEEQNIFYFAEWFQFDHLCNIRINNFSGFMDKLAPFLHKRLLSQKANLRLIMKNSLGIERWDSAKFSKKSKAMVSVKLTEIEMVRLLFGPERASEMPFINKNAEILDRIFPINFFINPLECL